MTICPRLSGECDCVVVGVITYFEGGAKDHNGAYHFACYQHSSLLVSHRQEKGNRARLELDQPNFTKEVMEFLVWYSTPKDLSPAPVPGDVLLPLRSKGEVLQKAVSRSDKCDFVEKLLYACDYFGFDSLVKLFSDLLRRSLMSLKSASDFRARLGIDNDLSISQEEERLVWERNSVDFNDPKGMSSTKLSVTSEVGNDQLALSLHQLQLPPIQMPRIPVPNESVTKCSFENCPVEFGMYEGRHHCRKCGRIFCAQHSSRSVRLPENEKMEPEVGFISSWLTYVRNFGDKSVSRICDGCHAVIEEEAKCRSAFLAFGVIGLEIPLLNRALVVSKSWRHAAQKCLGILANVQYKLADEKMEAIEKRMLWNNRENFVGHPRWLLQIIRVADLSRDSIAEEVYELLSVRKRFIKCRAALCGCLIDGTPGPQQQDCGGEFSPRDLLQLLKNDIKAHQIRKFAAEELRYLIPDKLRELQLYLPLLVEMLAYERLPDPSPLFETLLLAAKSGPSVRYDLYWALEVKGRKDYRLAKGGYESAHAWRYEALKQRLMSGLAVSKIEKGPGCKELVAAYSICQVFRSIPQGIPLEEVKQRLAVGLAPYRGISTPCLFDPTHYVTAYHIEETKILSSATQPIVIPMTVECSTCDASCPYRLDKGIMDNVKVKKQRKLEGGAGAVLGKKRTKRRMMYKYEDVRKDYLMLNAIKLMDLLLKREVPELDAERVTYRVIPTSASDGFVEFVEGALTIHEVNQEENKERVVSIQNWLMKECAASKNFTDVREMYVRSMAFWSVVTLLLGVGDRHLCNIMIKPNGALFHIDYGFILGEDPKLGMPLMRITQDMIDVMGGTQGRMFLLFKEYSCKIYRKIRQNSEIFFDLCKVLFMLDPPLDGKKPVTESYQIALMERLMKRFNWRVDSDDADNILLNWIQQSTENLMPEFYGKLKTTWKTTTGI